MAMMTAFIIGRIISRRIQHKREMKASAAAADVMKPGGSLLNTTIEEMSKQINTERNVSIQISNYSHKYILTNPRVFTSSGHSHNPPQPTIQKRTIEACSFSKTAGTACGSVGVLIYEIQTHDHRDCVGQLAIMFSVPYDYSQSENWFALGILDEYIFNTEQLFQQMYNGVGSFIRDKSTGSEIQFSGRNASVKGTMSPANRSIMYVELWDV